MSAYYNDNDPNAARVLRCLIADGVIPPGEVDQRSIKEVSPDDLKGFIQCHFFAGGGLWAVAARIAGWPDNRPLWTGSCPCQPHSTAAADRRKGFEDERDLWDAWFRLIAVAQPVSVAGEQVDDNPAWLDRMHADMEGAGFALGALDLPTCAVDAPQIRMRSFFMGNADRAGRGEQGWPFTMGPQQFPSERPGDRSRFGHHETTGELGRRRRVEPGVRLLADDVPGRVALIRIGGNAINPHLAAAFLRAFLDVEVEAAA